MSQETRYDPRTADRIERKWQAWWQEHETYRQPNPGEPDFDASKPKYFGLDMFPYPSAAGLHVGHPLSYTALDIVCRHKRMRGHNVLRATGFDAFGLPAEQHAVRTGVHPSITTREAMANYRLQLKRCGFSYDWSREFATIEPDYYKWTQWIFLRIYDSWFDRRVQRGRPIGELVAELEAGQLRVGPDNEPVTDAGRAWGELSKEEQRAFLDDQRLAYVAEETVNWCPKLGTALANEEVIDGRSERGHHPVVRKPLKQWLFRITAYADRLIEGLADIDWPESTKTMQTEWIGRSEGAEIDFPLADRDDHLRVYTTRPDTIFGATYMVLAPEHPLVSEARKSPELAAYVEAARNRSDLERIESKEKTGVFSGLYATNPATGERIPIWVADYVLIGYGHGAIMAVPGQDQRDWDFAKVYDLPIVRTVQPTPDFDGEAFLGDGPAINSGFLDGLGVTDAVQRTIEWLEENGLGRAKVNYKLRDWLFSRQRYWGEPFPIVWDEEGHHHGVGEETLPVRLPEMADFKPVESDDPQPMLAKATDWLHTTAGAAGVQDLPADTPVIREANTMPNWAGSCWYYLRYTDSRNDASLAARDLEGYWMRPNGVDLYIGGAEHATLHLLYARFWHLVLYDLGHVSTPEPFYKMFHQGMIQAFAYQRPDKSLVPIDEVEERDGHDVEKATGERVTRIVAKMSKSLHNVVNPDECIAEYSADTFRLYLMYLGPVEDSKPWDPSAISGMLRFLQRVWRRAVNGETGEIEARTEVDAEVEKRLHRTIAKVGDDLDKLAFNTAIAAMIEFVNEAEGFTKDQLDRFVRLLAPFAPHIAEELWHRLGHESSVAHAAWPTYDEAQLTDEEIEIPVQIKGKVRSRIRVPVHADREALEKAALADARIRELIEGQTVRKVIVVPGRLVNIVC
ncbi:MAG: leucine--tRNA ligase [Planctomycetota bacterium]|jgi:leucyl-tRNA synthetase